MHNATELTVDLPALIERGLAIRNACIKLGAKVEGNPTTDPAILHRGN